MSYTFGSGIPTYNGIPMIGGIPPITGTYYHVNPRIGSNGNKGTSSKRPLDTFVKAEDLLTTAVGDGIIVWSQGNSGADTTTYFTSAMAFDKSGCTVVGVHAGQSFKGRARMSASATYDLAYMMDVSGSNNSFYNLHFGNDGDANTALGCVRVTGNRNYFYNCHFVGGNHATPAAVALNPGTSYGAHDLLVSASELTFERCTFGDNSVIHAGNNANVVFGTQLSKVEFKDCRFVKHSTTAGTGALGFYATNCLNGWVTFDNCIFTCWASNEVATANTSMIIGSEQTNSGLLFHNCSVVGWSEIDDATSSVCYSNQPAAHASSGVCAAAG